MGKRATTFAELRTPQQHFYQTLVEIKPREAVTDTWTNAGAPNTAVYYVTIAQHTDCHNVRSACAAQADNVDLTSRASVVDVQANAGSWYFDPATSRLYVRLNPTADPTVGHLVTFDFWVYFSLGGDQPGMPTVFNGNDYRPLVVNVPSITREMSSQLWGTPVTSVGSIQLANPATMRGTRAVDPNPNAPVWFTSGYSPYTLGGFAFPPIIGADNPPPNEGWWIVAPSLPASIIDSHGVTLSQYDYNPDNMFSFSLPVNSWHMVASGYIRLGQYGDQPSPYNILGVRLTGDVNPNVEPVYITY